MTRTAMILVVAMSLTGAALAAGIMWFQMVADGVDYTFESWALIPALWAAPVAAALVATRLALAGGALLLVTSVIASTYYADVWAFAPGAVLFGLAIEVCLRSVVRQRAEARA